MGNVVGLLGLLVLAFVVWWGIWYGKRRIIPANRRINADVAFLRSIPAGVEGRGDQ